MLPSLSPDDRVWCAGTATVRRTRIGCSGQSSLSSSGTSSTSSGLPRPWKNQLWFSNWIHAAASTFRVVAGWNSCRVMSSSETFRALGSWRRGGFSGRIRFGSTFRVNALSVDPMSGSFRSFHLPSGRRAFSASSGGSSIPCLRIGVEVPNRFMSRRSSRSDKRFKAFSPVVGSSYQARFLLTRLNTPRRTLLESDLLTASPPARCSPTCLGSSIPTRARATPGQGSRRAQPLDGRRVPLHDAGVRRAAARDGPMDAEVAMGAREVLREPSVNRGCHLPAVELLLAGELPLGVDVHGDVELVGRRGGSGALALCRDVVVLESVDPERVALLEVLAELDPCVRRRPRGPVVPAVGREGSSRPDAGSD